MKATSDGLAAGLLAIATGVLASLAPAQSDTWWLLRAGREIVSTSTIPLTDSYSWTAAGMYWPNHEWLTAMTFYLVHTAAGMPGLAFLTTTLVLTASILSWRIAEGPFELRLVAFGVALVASTSVFAIRPQVLTLAAFSLSCLLLRYDKLWLLPLLIAIWVNFHGAAILGLVALLAAVASDVISIRLWPLTARRTRLARVFAVAVLSAAATLTSPLGVRLWTFIPESTERSRINQLVEWSAPGLAPHYLPFWLAGAAVMILTVLRWRFLDRDRRRVVAVALAVLPLAVQSMRNVPIFLLAGLPALTMLAAARRPRAPGAAAPGRGGRRSGENERVNGIILIALGTIAVVFVALAWTVPPPMLQWQPVNASAARAIAGCDAPMYNTYGTGGEIIWFVPEQKVFVDNRQDPYPPQVLAAAKKVEQDGDYRALFGQYGIRCAALPPNSVIARALRAAPDWTVSYEDRQWVVLTKRR